MAATGPDCEFVVIEELISDIKSMDEVMPRPTADAQKELLDRIRNANQDNDDETLEEQFNVA